MGVLPENAQQAVASAQPLPSCPSVPEEKASKKVCETCLEREFDLATAVVRFEGPEDKTVNMASAIQSFASSHDLALSSGFQKDRNFQSSPWLSVADRRFCWRSQTARPHSMNLRQKRDFAKTLR